MCNRDTETLLISGTCPYSLYHGSTSPGLEVFGNQQELFNVTSTALFCILQVWQDFVRDVVLSLPSRGTNFHSSKHIRNCTQDWLANFRSTQVREFTDTLFLFSFINFQAELLVFVEEHFDFQPA